MSQFEKSCLTCYTTCYKHLQSSGNCPEVVGKIAAAGLPKLRDFDHQGTDPHGGSNRKDTDLLVQFGMGISVSQSLSGLSRIIQDYPGLSRIQTCVMQSHTISSISSAENTWCSAFFRSRRVQFRLLLHMYQEQDPASILTEEITSSIKKGQ